MTKREKIEETLKKKKYEESLILINEFIESYPFDLEGYLYLVQAKTKNYTKDINKLFENEVEQNTLNLIRELKELVIKFDPKDKATLKIEDYILDLTKNLNTKIEGKPIKKTLSENVIAGLITIIILSIILLIIVL